MRLKRIPTIVGAVFAVAGAGLAGAREASASVITLGVPNQFISTVSGSSSITARYKYDMGGGVDQMLFKQPNPAGFPAVDLIRMNPVSNQWFGSASYLFTVSHTASTGQYSFSLTNGAVTGQATFANTTAMNSTRSITLTPGEVNYNLIHVYALGSNSSTVSWSDLTFTPGSGLTTEWGFPSSGSVTNGASDLWAAAPQGTNLDSFDWTLSARVSLILNGPRANNEALKFELTGKQGTVIPEPAAMGLLSPA